jgi:hypothetical protein
VNFGSIYGQGAAGLVQSAWAQFDLILDLAEAATWLQAIEQAYYRLAQWRRDHYQQCEDRRFIVIGKDAARGIGRVYPKSHVPEGLSYYTRCCNLPIQGICADISMQALAYVDDRLFEAGIDGGPVAWLHDEIVIEVRADQATQAAEILKQSMVDAFAEALPGAPLNGLVEPHIAMNWGETKKKKAPVNAPPPRAPDLATVYAERVRLLSPDVSEDEARARAYDYVVSICRARYGVGLEVAKRAVLTVLKAQRDAAAAALGLEAKGEES